jgi:type II secretory pathway predicted ATPase ExeA
MKPNTKKTATTPTSYEAILQRYTHLWGITGVPFTEDNDQSYQQHLPQIEQAHQKLSQSAAFRSVMLLSGPNGVGKSYLVSHWQQALDPRLYRAIAITQASLSHAGLLAYLARKLGKPGGIRCTLLVHLEEAFAELGQTTPVIILDEAQNYSGAALEEIRMLLGIGLKRRSAFSLILVGDEYLLATLRLRSQRALYGRIACFHGLDRWQAEEIQQLLESSQNAVGLSESCIDPTAMELMLSASNGLPRTALHVARASWLAASQDGATRIEASHVQSILPSIPIASDYRCAEQQNT